jgi:hypothetical protein
VARSNPLQSDAFTPKILEKTPREFQAILNCIQAQTAYGSEIICKFFENFGRGVYRLRLDFEAVHKTEPIGDRVCKQPSGPNESGLDAFFVAFQRHVPGAALISSSESLLSCHRSMWPIAVSI